MAQNQLSCFWNEPDFGGKYRSAVSLHSHTNHSKESLRFIPEFTQKNLFSGGRLALTSDTIRLPRMYDAADSILAQKLAQVNGVGQVFVGGGARPAVRAEINPSQ